MTDNEKRAHDIAITVLPARINNAIDTFVKTGNADNAPDVYQLYKSTYEMTLKALNQDYPDQK